MTRLEALKLLEQMQDTDPESLPVPPEARESVQTPLSLASIASLSGMLDDATDVPGLIAACEYGLDLVGMDIVTYDQWDHELRDIAREKIASFAPLN